MPVAHLATADAPLARRGVERRVDPTAKCPVIAEDDLRRSADVAQVVVWRINLRGEWAGVEAPLAGEYRKAAHTPGSEAMEVGLAIPVVGLRGAGARVEEDLVALKDAVGICHGPGLQQ